MTYTVLLFCYVAAAETMVHLVPGMLSTLEIKLLFCLVKHMVIYVMQPANTIYKFTTIFMTLRFYLTYHIKTPNVLQVLQAA